MCKRIERCSQGGGNSSVVLLHILLFLVENGLKIRIIERHEQFFSGFLFAGGLPGDIYQGCERCTTGRYSFRHVLGAFVYLILAPCLLTTLIVTKCTVRSANTTRCFPHILLNTFLKVPYLVIHLVKLGSIVHKVRG